MRVRTVSPPLRPGGTEDHGCRSLDTGTTQGDTGRVDGRWTESHTTKTVDTTAVTTLVNVTVQEPMPGPYPQERSPQTRPKFDPRGRDQVGVWPGRQS